MTIQFTLNGAKQSLDLDPTMPLLWALRDVLNLTGTKLGCGIDQCGACTVHLNGVAVRSCPMPVAGIANQTITTIEGLSAEGLTPLQEAWVETDVPQFGYCQVGQTMAAAAGDADRRRSDTGHLCCERRAPLAAALQPR